MELNRKNLNEEDLEKEFIWKLVIGDIVSAKNLFPAVNNEEIINFAIKNRICIQLLNCALFASFDWSRQFLRVGTGLTRLTLVERAV